jgi:hypothetical protein
LDERYEGSAKASSGKPEQRSMTTFRASWLAVGLIVSAFPVVGLAQDLPKIDSDKYCEAASALADENPAAQNLSRDTCLNKEAASEQKLARVWPEVPASDRRTCLKYLALTLPSHQGLAVCIGRVMGEHYLNGDLPVR